MFAYASLCEALHTLVAGRMHALELLNELMFVE